MLCTCMLTPITIVIITLTHITYKYPKMIHHIHTLANVGCNFLCYVNVLVFYVLGLDSCVVPGELVFESPKVI